MMMRLCCVVALMLCVLCAPPVMAQNRSTTHGFMLGAHLFGVGLDAEDREDDDGGGFGLTVAYGFRNRVSLFQTGSVAAMEASEDGARDYIFGAGDLGVRYTFGTTAARWRPFLTAALSGITITYENIVFGDFGRSDVDISGGALTAGGGVQLFPDRRIALDGALLFSGGSFDEVKVDNVTVELEGDDRIDLTVVRLQLGLRYYFGRD
jgi:hypothetical protein